MQRRVLTALALLALVLSGFLFRDLQWIPLLLLMAVAVICTLELYHMMRSKGLHLYRRVASWGVLALVVEAAFFSMQYSLIVFGLAACLAWLVRMPGRVQGALADVSATCFALAYLGIPFAALARVFVAGPEARAWLLLMLVIIWSTDIAALFVGKRYGRHKLWPKISPGKTVEGSFGGVAGALLAVMIFATLAPSFFVGVGPYEWVAVGIGFSVIGQYGDLAESLLKRDMGTKDSGHYLPGHGGFLDRMDSILFAAIPLLAYLALVHPEVLG